MKPSARFRHLLAQSGLIVAPGAYDGLSAKLIEQAGFDVVYATGGVFRAAADTLTSAC
jgi:2-methylisocitrate lyase-like PEP mutase family enzyme